MFQETEKQAGFLLPVCILSADFYNQILDYF